MLPQVDRRTLLRLSALGIAVDALASSGSIAAASVTGSQSARSAARSAADPGHPQRPDGRLPAVSGGHESDYRVWEGPLVMARHGPRRREGHDDRPRPSSRPNRAAMAPGAAPFAYVSALHNGGQVPGRTAVRGSGQSSTVFSRLRSHRDCLSVPTPGHPCSSAAIQPRSWRCRAVLNRLAAGTRHAAG